ncbi:LacI family DNA-binding transcriptional regulator [Microbacterium sp. KSW2-29]|uniref:LacI family DNA-binding transcriptional regulator n=1 Tax=Microbacterium phycohabitans TaxID=3075993 RepID=A0ABU3SL44_9MICO|nr:LacI family DNA-binding transcriptional regulator [Microbacterium sp. KSW2-29]MDU0345102.1 LacI family DNA-binding transcriptional regulator [Microbacterium sp. KSW2-29]
MTDVARAAGVAIGTVSNVLNHPDKVAPATLERVQGAIAQLGFVRNTNAQQLAAGRSRSIGLVVIDISNSLFVDIARGAQRYATELSMNVLVANSDNRIDQQRADLDFFDGARVGGILLAPMEDAGDDVARIRTHGRPTIMLNYDTGRNDCCQVLVDNEEVGYLAARHLIEIGRTRLAFVGGRDYLQPVALRRRGVRRAVAEENGRVTLQEIPTENLDPPGGLRAGEELAPQVRDGRLDGVIAVTDLLAMALIQVFGAEGIAVPGDVAVMGCDHNSAAWGGMIPLTSVQMQGIDMGREGVRLLLAELGEDPATHEHVTTVLRPELVVRESTVGRSAISAASV